MSRSKVLLLVPAVVLAFFGYAKPVAVTMADTTSTPTSAAAVMPVSAPASKILYLRITAYASVPDETDDTPFETATGEHVYDGGVASNNLPFGTKIQIPALFGDKVFTVNDRMNARYKSGIDVWMNSVAKASYFGMSYAHVVVVSTPADQSALAANFK